MKLVITEKEVDEDEQNPVRYLVTNKINALTTYVIRSHGMRWRIETFFENLKQDLGLGDCEMQTDEGVSRHWSLLMAAYGLFRLDSELSAFDTIGLKASSLRANLEHSLKKAVYTSSREFGITITEASMTLLKRSTTASFTQLLTLTCKAE